MTSEECSRSSKINPTSQIKINWIIWIRCWALIWIWIGKSQTWTLCWRVVLSRLTVKRWRTYSKAFSVRTRRPVAVRVQVSTCTGESALRDTLRARLHQASPSTRSQRCDDASDTALIEINGVSPEWVETPFWSNSVSIVFNEINIASTIAIACCKRNLSVFLHWERRQKYLIFADTKYGYTLNFLKTLSFCCT